MKERQKTQGFIEIEIAIEIEKKDIQCFVTNEGKSPGNFDLDFDLEWESS